MKKLRRGHVLLLCFSVFMLAMLLTSAYGQQVNFQQNVIVNAGTTTNDERPYTGQKWAVTDGVSLFDFGVTSAGNIAYQVGPATFSTNYLRTPITFLDSSQVYGQRGVFTLTQGAVIGNSFIFDAVWSSGNHSISIMELTDLYQLNGNGPFFTPTTVSTGALVTTITTDAFAPVNLQAINLPNGDVIVGDSEQVDSLHYEASAYHYVRGTNPTMTLVATFVTTTIHWSLQPEYVEPFVYYVTGCNTNVYGACANTIGIYQASQANGWVPNGTQIVNNVLYPYQGFIAEADPTHLYVAGFSFDTFFVEAMNNSNNQMSANVFQINATTNLNWNSTGNTNVFLSTYMFGTGVHFYYFYNWKGDGNNNIWMGGATSYDGGRTWMEQTQIAQVGGSISKVTGFGIAGAPRTPWNFNPTWDYMEIWGFSPTFTTWYLYALQNTWPVLFRATTVSAVTQTVYTALASSTTTITTFTGPSVTGDIVTPFVMLIVVGLPAAGFALIGTLFSGGKAGLTLLLMGTGLGLFIGIIMGIYPLGQTLILLVLALLAGFVNQRKGVSMEDSGEFH